MRWVDATPPRHVHVLPSLSVGGAERMVLDVARMVARGGGVVDVIVLRDKPVEHADAAVPGMTVHRLGGLSADVRLDRIAEIAEGSLLPIFCHLLKPDELAGLHARGLLTIPVVHNARAGWKADPADWAGNPSVPFVAACGRFVAAELLHAAPGLRVRVMRHVVPPPAPMDPERRAAVRRAFGVGDDALLVGMTGRIVPQKNHVRAVGVLAAMLRLVPARLVILGDAPGSEGAAARERAERAAHLLGVREDVLFMGAVRDAADLAPAFDVHLCTSDYEGVSLATMEAIAAGVPVVTSDVGGQLEAVGRFGHVLSPDADFPTWAEACVSAARAGGRVADPAARTRLAHAAALRWPWTAAFSTVPVRAGGRRMFVTGNMNAGGAQRSLCNLAAELARRGEPPVIAICGPVGVPGFMDEARSAGAEFFDLSGGGGLAGRMSRVLSLARFVRPSSVTFWNMDPQTKAALASCLSDSHVLVTDVSPGPAMFRELERASDDIELLGGDVVGYLTSLDVLVSKHSHGFVLPKGATPKRLAVIPNGVPAHSSELRPSEGPMPPPGCPQSLAVVCVGRIVAEKKARLLPAVATMLGRLVPGSTITVVGGAHGAREEEEFARMLDACGGVLPANLHLVGPDHRVSGFLPRFAAFLMLSVDQGCPNASLEAMAAGLPVVANDDGGTREQVVDGSTGYLVSACSDPELVVASSLALAGLLSDPTLARAMGAKGRERAITRFSMADMASRYVAALDAKE